VSVLGKDGKGVFNEAWEGCVFGGLGFMCVRISFFGSWMLVVACIYFHGHVVLRFFSAVNINQVAVHTATIRRPFPLCYAILLFHPRIKERDRQACDPSSDWVGVAA
jgi:hypothetical protein